MSTTSQTAPRTANQQLSRAYVALVSGLLCIGFAGVFTVWSGAPGLVMSSWRLAIAAVLLLIPFLRQPASERHMTRRQLGWTMLAGAFFAGDVGLWAMALETTTVANATFIVNTAPIWVGLFTLIVLRKSLPQLFWPGTAAALFGAALIVFGGKNGITAQPGDLLALFASLFWAGYQLVLGRARASGVSNITSVWVVSASGALMLIPLALLSGHSMFGYGMIGALSFLAAGGLSQVAGYLGINYALGTVPAPRASVVILLQPIIATIASFLLLGQALGMWQILGGGLILAGVYMVTIWGRDA